MTWFNTNYLRKKALTIDHTKVSGGSDLANFPVLISRIDADLKTVGNGGFVQNSSGFDIIFTDSTETTKLDHEIEQYVGSTGEIEMWVRIPTLSASSDTIIYMYFDNSSISTSQENKTGVWDANFKTVYHLKESTGSNPADSTSNALTATQNNSPTQGAGKIDGSLAFNQALLQYLSIAGTSANIIGDKTVEMWMNPSTFNTQAGASQRWIFNNIDGTNVYQIAIGSTTGFVWSVNDSSGQNITSNNTTLTTGIWYHVVGVYTASSHVVILYINGASTSNNGGASGFGVGTAGFNIGRRVDGVGYITGSLDEIRISNTVRSAGWIATSYNAQNSPGTFYSVGAIQTNPVTNTRTIPSTVALLQTNTRSIPSTSALIATNTRTIPSTSALLATSTRTIPSSAALLQPNSRSIPNTAVLLATNTRVVPSNVALLATQTRSIPSTASLSNPAPSTNVTFYVRSGKSTFYVRKGNATFYIR